MLIIRRLNCIDTASGIVTLCRCPFGAQVVRVFSYYKIKILCVKLVFTKVILRCTVREISKLCELLHRAHRLHIMRRSNSADTRRNIKCLVSNLICMQINRSSNLHYCNANTLILLWLFSLQLWCF
jgi:hypothetical protein